MIEFERRNNLSTTLELQSDESSSLLEFWDDELIKSFSNLDELILFLKNGKLKLTPGGRAVSPIEIINKP